MKNIFFLIAFGLFQTIYLCGQTKVSKTTAKANIIVDTVPADTIIIIDTNVISFNCTIMINGVAVTKKISNSYISTGGFKSGEVIFLDDITAIDKNRKRIKLPERKYVIR